MNRGEIGIINNENFFLYGPGLMLLDYNLGILYLLAMSSLATYGILLAGFPNFSTFLHTKNLKIKRMERTFSTPRARARSITNLDIKSTSFFLTRSVAERSNYLNFAIPFLLLNQRCKRFGLAEKQKCSIHTYPAYAVVNNSNNSNNNKEEYIKNLFKHRVAPVIPFDRNLIKGSCLNYTDKVSKAKFLKIWGGKVGIYLIEYKYYPDIFYIGRTNQIKKRLYEHSKAESNSKFNLFMRLTGGIKQFNIHILEVCAETKLGERETYYLQKYIPVLNSVFSSSITEGVIKQTLLLNLKDLRAINRRKDSKSILVYVYELTEKGISHQPTIYNNSREASRDLSYSISDILRYKNTSIPYRGKLFFNYPIVDFNLVFEEAKNFTPKGL
jgi:hypothetical protein